MSQWNKMIVITTVLLGLWRPAAARSPAELEQAREAWKAGSALFDKGDFKAARARFEQGFRLSGKGGFLYNIGECARLAGDTMGAHAAYTRYLREFADGKHRDAVLEKCRGLGLGPCSTLKATPAPPPTPKAADEPGPDLSPPAPAGQAKQPGPFTSPAPPAPTTRSTRWYKHWGFWTAVGAVVVAGTVTAIAVAARPGDPSTPAGDATLSWR